METPEQLALVLLIILVLVSASFSLIKSVFSGIYAKRDARDRDDDEEKVAALVEWGGFNETISIGRIFCNVGSGVLGFFLFEKLPYAWIHDFWFLGFAVYLILACAFIYMVTVFFANFLGSLKPDTLSFVLVPVFRIIRLPFMPVAIACHWLFVKLLKIFG